LWFFAVTNTSLVHRQNTFSQGVDYYELETWFWVILFHLCWPKTKGNVLGWCERTQHHLDLMRQ
jgi:hypothetical protein